MSLRSDIVCFYMVAIPEAAIPTDRDRIGTPPPQRVEPYKNNLQEATIDSPSIRGGAVR